MTTRRGIKDAYLYHSTPITTHNLKSYPYKNLSETSSEKPFLSEWRLSLAGLLFAILVIGGKLCWANHETIKNFVIEPRLISYEVITEDGRVMFEYTWKSVVKYSSIWLPALCGVLSTYCTWILVYLDSSVPGVQPPSPFSPTKYKARSGHSFHLNYVFAVVVGVLISGYMYWKNISIQY